MEDQRACDIAQEAQNKTVWETLKELIPSVICEHIYGLWENGCDHGFMKDNKTIYDKMTVFLFCPKCGKRLDV